MNLELLKAKRKKAKVSQEEVALALGYKNKSSYSLIESGKNQLPIGKLNRLKVMLNLTDNELLHIFCD